MAKLRLVVYCLTALAAAFDPAFAYSPVIMHWPKALSPPSTLVIAETDYGSFRLPIGYLSEAYELAHNFKGRDNNGNLRYDLGELMYRFTMPSGDYNFNVDLQMHAFDSSGHRDPDPTKYVVWVTRMNPLHLDTFVPEEVKILSSATTEGELFAHPSKEDPRYFYGHITVPETADQAGMSLDCAFDNCYGDYCFKKLGLDLTVLMPNDNKNKSVFDVARVMSIQLNGWSSK